MLASLCFMLNIVKSLDALDFLLIFAPLKNSLRGTIMPPLCGCFCIIINSTKPKWGSAVSDNRKVQVASRRVP